MELAGRRVLVWGWGRHGGGAAAARFCAERGARVEILDARPAEDLGAAVPWPWHVGDGAHPALQAADLVVASPAIPPRAWPAGHPPVASPEGLFLAHHRGPRAAVTGTKGKSTTAAILGRLLGWEVAGNGWEPLLDLLARRGPEVPVVCEMSSFQAWYLREQKPAFALGLLTTLATDHLDWHPDVGHYRGAKLALLGWCEAVVTAVSVEAGPPRIPLATCDGERFHAPDGAWLADRADLALPGPHNAANACLALAAALHLGRPRQGLRADLRQVVSLPHRLQTVHAAGAWRCIDDSIATTPESAMAALAAISGPLAVILGGSDKGADWGGLAAAVAQRGARPVLIGQTAPRIAAALAGSGVAAARAADLDAAVRACLAALPAGGSILLSPACASFDMFRGFEDRGRRFADSCRRLVGAGA